MISVYPAILSYRKPLVPRNQCIHFIVTRPSICSSSERSTNPPFTRPIPESGNPIEKSTINTDPHASPRSPSIHRSLTVRFLVPRARTGTAKLLGLAPPVIGHQQCTVVLNQRLLQLVLAVLVDVFLVVGNDGFGNRLSDCVYLRGVTSAGDAHADVDISLFNISMGNGRK